MTSDHSIQNSVNDIDANSDSFLNITVADQKHHGEIAFYIERGPVHEDAQAPWEDFPEIFDTFENAFKSPVTGVWEEYGIDPTAELLPKEPKSLHTLIPRKELEKFKSLEKRIQIEGQQFTIMESSEFLGSLFRAVSNAVTDSEKSHKLVQSRIFSEIERNLMEFVTEIGDYCGHNLLQEQPLDRPLSLLSKFKHRFLGSNSGAPLFCLRAAGIAFKFRYVLIDANDYNGSAVVASSEQWIQEHWDTLFYFMRTGTYPDTWFYQFLIPIGPPKFPWSGKFPLLMYDVIQVDREINPESNSSKRPGSYFPSLMQVPAISLSLDHKTYFYQPTRTHDLWALISELLFYNIQHAPIIYEMAMRMKFEEANYYHFSKFKKRQLMKGHSQSRKHMENYRRSIKFVHKHRGDIQDLQRLSEAIKFSYTLIGLDTHGTFFWTEGVTSQNNSSTPGDEPRKVSLFVKMLKNRQLFWYSLDDCGLDFIKEKAVYENLDLTDNTSLRQDLYSKRPSVYEDAILGSVAKVVPSAKPRLRSKLSDAFTQGKTVSGPPSFNIPRGSLGSGSVTIFSIFHRISEWVTRIFRRHKVAPESLDVSFRDHP